MSHNIMSESAEGLPRKLTAVGTVGHLNQLFTVFEKNWNCADCGQENYAARPKCFRCKKSKPQGQQNYVIDPAFHALQGGKENPWQEVVDPASYQVYYYNKETGVTQWERPLEMGAAPFNTGWFGRGQAGSSAAQMYIKLNEKYLSRPARKQKDFIDPRKYHVEGANEYNIWYGKFLGDQQDKFDREPASDRCNLATDAGRTKADTGNEDKKNRRFFCLHFARGMCAKGADCSFFHRVPLPEDDAKCDELFDCFGRQRHNKHKDDMTGVGSFMKPCRTLFVGNLLKHKYTTPKQLEDTLWRHFCEWGELESLNVVYRLSIAFPRYRLRTSAEFAKEAMSNQQLDQEEILLVKWAHDDPNPVAQDAIDRANKDALVALMKAKGISIAEANFDYPANYSMPETKKMQLGDEKANALLQHFPELAYPDTDVQFNQPANAADSDAFYAQSGMTEEQYKQYWEYYNQYLTGMPGASTVGSSSATDADSSLQEVLAGKKRSLELLAGKNSEDNKQDISDEEENEDSADESNGWTVQKDDKTGASYFFNVYSGESSWTKPDGYLSN